MTSFIEYKKKKNNKNIETVKQDLKNLEELNNKDLQMDLKMKNSNKAATNEYIKATCTRKSAMDQLKEDVRAAYGDAFADEVEKAANKITPDIFDC